MNVTFSNAPLEKEIRLIAKEKSTPLTKVVQTALMAYAVAENKIYAKKLISRGEAKMINSIIEAIDDEGTYNGDIDEMPVSFSRNDVPDYLSLRDAVLIIVHAWNEVGLISSRVGRGFFKDEEATVTKVIQLVDTKYTVEWNENMHIVTLKKRRG